MPVQVQTCANLITGVVAKDQSANSVMFSLLPSLTHIHMQAVVMGVADPLLLPCGLLSSYSAQHLVPALSVTKHLARMQVAAMGVAGLLANGLELVELKPGSMTPPPPSALGGGSSLQQGGVVSGSGGSGGGGGMTPAVSSIPAGVPTGGAGAAPSPISLASSITSASSLANKLALTGISSIWRAASGVGGQHSTWASGGSGSVGGTATGAMGQGTPGAAVAVGAGQLLCARSPYLLRKVRRNLSAFKTRYYL